MWFFNVFANYWKQMVQKAIKGFHWIFLSLEYILIEVSSILWFKHFAFFPKSSYN